MTGMAPGVERARQTFGLDQIDAAVGPAGWLLREDGSPVCWGHAGVLLFDLNALGCPCRCHQPPALDTARSTT